jgi:hypothetical protein
VADSLENKLVDKRVAHRYVRKGVVDEKDFEKHLRSLPDLADQAVPVEALMEGMEVDEDDEDVEDEAGAAEPANP